MDLPCYQTCIDDDFITKEKGTMPDLLLPLEKQKNVIKVTNSICTVGVATNIPWDLQRGALESFLLISIWHLRQKGELICF